MILQNETASTLYRRNVYLGHYRLAGLVMTLSSDLENLFINGQSHWQVSIKSLHYVKKYHVMWNRR